MHDNDRDQGINKPELPEDKEVGDEDAYRRCHPRGENPEVKILPAGKVQSGQSIGGRNSNRQDNKGRDEPNKDTVEIEGNKTTRLDGMEIVGQGGAKHPFGRHGESVHLGFQGHRQHPEDWKYRPR